MKLTRITIKGHLAHFKKPAGGKVQETYTIPPISTVIGILQNIYNKDIENFKFGYTIDFSQKHKDLMTIYKEVNLMSRTTTDSRRFTKEICNVEYLSDVVLTIYTDLKEDIELHDVLTLGKTNCLATITEIKEVELIDFEGYGYNQYTPKHIGNGRIITINTLTKFNEDKCMYDFHANKFRENLEFEYDKNYDTEIEQNIFLFNYKREGEVFWN